MSKKEVKFMAEDKSAKNVKKKMDKLHAEAAPNQTVVAGVGDGRYEALGDDEDAAPRTPGRMDEQFPTDDLTQEDPRDKIMAAKLALADKQGVTPFGQLIASDSDFDWLDRKRAKEDEADLQAWFAQNYDFMAPEQKAVARRLWPDFYAQRQRMLERNVRLQQRIAELKLHGPQNKNDLMLQYAIESGYIPADPLENILHPERTKEAREREARQATFARGLLNPKARTTRGGTTYPRVVNAAQLSGFNPERVPGDPAYSGTRDSINQKYGFSVSDWPLSDLYPREETSEGNLFGPQAMARMQRDRPLGRAAPVAGGGQ